MRRTMTILLVCAGFSFLTGCEDSSSDQPGKKPDAAAHNAGTHTHADGSTHADHEGEERADASDHAHDEVPLGAVTIGDMRIELAQGHGKVEAGKESHLVVKLPYNDKGQTVVRAWLGTDDRTLSLVGKGEYAASHGDYDIHATAPDPLPEGVMWWLEIEKPDDTKAVGAAEPMLD